MSEYLHVEKPFLDQLAALGWTVIGQGQAIVPSSPAASLRSSFREWILPEVFRESVRALNRTEQGDAWLTDRQLDDLREQLLRHPHRGFLEANEVVHGLLLKAQVDRNELTGEDDPVVKLIDFANPERNQFHAINQFRVDTPGAVKAFITPDIVLFVNGIPLIVVEAKTADATRANPMHEAFVQLLRYRNARPETAGAGLREGEPRLFYSNLLLIRTSGGRAEFGTISSGEEHFYAWQDIWPDTYRNYTPPLRVEREQERLIQGLLPRSTLLEILRTCTLFMDTDSGHRVKVVCRYQQYRAAKKVIDRLRRGRTTEERSGVVWHTQGSGKSLTMVFVARMLRASPDLADYKVVMVNDRTDLEEQLTGTAKLIGGKVNVIANTKDLRRHLSTDASDLNMVMVHKFLERSAALPPAVAAALSPSRPLPSAETFGVVNASDRIVLMIDEAHRTQSSDLGNNLMQAFPNAARVAFTGTPLITEEHGPKRTVKRFGEYIDKYKLMDSVHDGATLQILYEGRTADTVLRDRHEFDAKFEDLFRERTSEELEAIKKKYGATGDILEAKNRIDAIARDLVAHYVDNILPDGFKAQVVCHSKLAAIRYRDAIRAAIAERIARERLQAKPDEALLRRLEFLKVVAVISADPVNEPAVFTEARKEAKRWDAIENFCRPFAWEDPEKELTGIAFLVVCDMLLTGFDAPVEQVMYIDKRLYEHNLLQAIARVNRVAKNKHRGFIVDYIGLANHLADALKIYSEEEAADIQHGLKDVLTELPVLEERYNRLIDHFRSAGIGDIQRFVRGETDDIRIAHAAVESLEDLKRRADFEVYLNTFLQSLNLILPNAAGHGYRGPARRFGWLMQMVKERYKDTSLNIADAGAKVKELINAHLVELGIDPKIPPIELLADDFLAQVRRHAQGDSKAKASEMEHALRRHCTIHFDEDPAFFRRLSEKLEKLIQDQRDNWEALADGYEQLRSEAMQGRRTTIEGLSLEATTFHDHVAQLAFGGTAVPAEYRKQLEALARRAVDTLRETIGIIDFWKKPVEVKRLRGTLDTEILLSGIPQLCERHERIAVELVRLAEKRHTELVKCDDPSPSFPTK
jgi:type I restriction enzyme R subunit